MTSPATKNNPAAFDLAVCYRIYPRVSRDPIFGFKEKLPLVHLNLETFREALGNLRVKIWFLLDNCPPAYSELIVKLFPNTSFEIIALKGEGNEATFVRQIEILSKQTDAELIYFAEDDYLYLPHALQMGVEFMRRHAEADFVSLYDHADFHSKYVHQIRSPEFVETSRRWRQVVSTCLTFMGRREILAKTADVFRTYQRKNSDLGLWLALTKKRVLNPWSWLRSAGDGLFFPASHALAWRHAWRQILFGRRCTLWAPAPGLATHMECGGLAPDVDWEKLFGARASVLKDDTLQ